MITGRKDFHAEAWTCGERRFALALLLLWASAPPRETCSADSQQIRAAVKRSLPLLQKGAKSFRERSEGQCISCHHQGLILQTVALARTSGFSINETLAREEIERVHGFYSRRQQRYQLALSDPSAAPAADLFGNFTVHAGYWLWGLAAEGQKPDEALATTVRLLASKQWPDGRWSFTDTARAPMQAGDIAVTALAINALKNYGANDDRDVLRRRVESAGNWLAAAQRRTIDDKAFRLLGLYWSNARDSDCQSAFAELLSEQQADGGWRQQQNMPSDAYASGMALVAAATACDFSHTRPEYQAGVEYLIREQRADGSWFVRTHAIPTNPYFESGFPHEKSQFISYAGSCWATMALTLALADGANDR